MTLSMLLTPLLVPPVDLAVLAACGVLAWRRRAGRWLARAGLAALLVLALPVTGDALLWSLERDLPVEPAAPAAPVAPAAAIVVLGGDLRRDAASPLGAAPGGLTLDRLREGAALARRTGLPLLLTGGIVLTGAAPVATVMARSLHDDFGMAARWVEPVSATTWQNARDSAAILDAAGIRSVIVVTSAWHMRRALIAFRRTDLAAAPGPVRRDPAPRWDGASLVPEAAAWQASYYGLHEWIGCAWYRWLLWRGGG